MHCKRCNLCWGAKHVCIEGVGSDKPIILFVTGYPNGPSDLDGRPLGGRDWELFTRLMDRAGLPMDACRFTSIVRCVPWEIKGDRTKEPTEEQLDQCVPYLEKEILVHDPVVIVPLGPFALKYFTGDTRVKSRRGRRTLTESPSIRARYVRMIKILSRHGIAEARLIQETEGRREKALEYAHDAYGYEDPPRKSRMVYPMYHPQDTWGDPLLTEDILTDFNYLVSWINNDESDTDYKLLTTLPDIRGILQRVIGDYKAGKFKYLSFDIETTSLNMFDPNEFITTIGFSTKKGEGLVIPYDHYESPFKGDKLARSGVRSELNKLLEVVPILGHNLKFDYKWCVSRGMYPKIIGEDTELASWTLFNDTTFHDFETLASTYTDKKLHKQEMKEAMDGLLKEEKHNTNNYELDLVYRYNAADVDAEHYLEPVFTQMMIDQGLYEAHRRDCVDAVIPVSEMEINGCVLDIPLLEEMDVKLSAEMKDCYEKLIFWGLPELVENVIEDLAGKRRVFNLNAPEQVSILLFDCLGLEPKKYGKPRVNGFLKGKRVPSSAKAILLELWEETNEKIHKRKKVEESEGRDVPSEALQMMELQLQVLELVRDYKAVSKMHSSYVKSMPRKMDVDHYVRPEYGIRHTETGRYNCKNPSLQVLPFHSDIKKAFISRFQDGIIISADQSQMELRIFAAVTGDPELVKAFQEGRDIHRLIASRVLGLPEEKVLDDDRRRIKTVVFGLLYGRGKKSIAAQEKISVEKAEELINGVFRQFKLVARFVQDTHAYVRRHGRVPYINGFHRLLPVDPQDPSRAERQAVNSKIQGPASDLGANALIHVAKALRKFGWYSKHYQFVHDSLGFDVAPGELYDLSVLLQKEMQFKTARRFDFLRGVPLKIDFEIGVSWGHLVNALILDDGIIEFKGDGEYINMLLDRFSRWSGPPEILSHVVERKEKPASVSSGLRITADMIEYDLITVQVRFPHRTKEDPVFIHPPYDFIDSSRVAEA